MALDQRLELRQETFLVVADDRKMGFRNRRHRRNQPVESLLPVDAPEKQDQPRVRENRLDIAAGAFAVAGARAATGRSGW